jgi:hypothetical protein
MLKRAADNSACDNPAPSQPSLSDVIPWRLKDALAIAMLICVQKWADGPLIQPDGIIYLLSLAIGPSESIQKSLLDSLRRGRPLLRRAAFAPIPCQ